MTKIKVKVILLVIISLLLLGIIMGAVSFYEVRVLGQENVSVLDKKLREDFDTLAKFQVDSAMSIVEYYYERRNELGEDAARELARDALDNMIYGDSGYIFVYDSKGIAVAMAGADVEGENRWDMQDKQGNYLIRDLIQAAADGTNYTTYYFNKPGETEASPKRSYTALFAPWDWNIGTGNYIDDIDALVAQERELIQQKIKTILILIVIVCIAVIGLTSAIAGLLGSRIVKPLEQLVLDVNEIAQGDLTKNIKVTSNDETKLLANALGDMVVRLRNIVNGIVDASLEIESRAQEMADVSQKVSSGASQQAASTEEISASMEQLASNIQQNTDNSQKSNQIISQAASDADETGTAVEETVESMRFISEKINIIEEIARNTNLLALNAAIEAARAGEAGRGFAVVASEVRKLAEHSQTAATDITQVSSVSVKKADSTLSLIREMVPAIKSSSELSDEIFVASEEQAKGAEQINSALLEMDKVIQDNASSSADIAAMADDMKIKSNDLSQMVSFFRTGARRTVRKLPPVEKKKENVPSIGEEPQLTHQPVKEVMENTRPQAPAVQLEDAEIMVDAGSDGFEEF